MASDGGSSDTLVRCPRDSVETRLQCAECGTPICPACFVRTAVGLRCQSCGEASGPPRRGIASSRRGPVLAPLALVVALIVAGGAWAVTRGNSEAQVDVDEGGERVVIPSMAIGNGDLPGGLSWTLEARRDGGVCTILNVSPGEPTRERCLRTRSYRPVGNMFTRILESPAGRIYLSVGQVSDRAERVRISPDGAAPFEVPTLGGGNGFDVRFFVMHTTENVHMSLSALAADGTLLGRVERPKMPQSSR